MAQTSAACRCPRSRGVYFQIYRSTSASFTQIVLQGLRTRRRQGDLVGRSRETGWEPISEPVAVYTRIPDPVHHGHGHRKNQAQHRTAFRPPPRRRAGRRAGIRQMPALQERPIQRKRVRCSRMKRTANRRAPSNGSAPRPPASRSSTAATPKAPARHWMSRRKNRRASTNWAATPSPRSPARPSSKVAPRGRWNAKPAPPKDSCRASQAGSGSHHLHRLQARKHEMCERRCPGGHDPSRTGRNGGLLRRRQVTSRASPAIPS